jgi:DNA-binding FadR family transcriptional regulator
VNAEQWREVARPISRNLAAVLAEYGTLRFDPRDVPQHLYGRFWAAVERRDPEALRAASREISKEAERRMLKEAR